MNGILKKTGPSVVATATISFMSDKTIQVKLSTCDGINARMVDAVPGVVWKELNALRTKKRLADTVAQHALKQKAEAEERRVTEEKASAT